LSDLGLMEIKPRIATHIAQHKCIIGVVSDTHVPDRVGSLNPALLQGLDEHEVDYILHAGDICLPGVLEQLSQIAPVIAVRGNRDWAFRGKLPKIQKLDICGHRVALTHGYGDLFFYFFDKWYDLFQGYQLDRYQTMLLQQVEWAQVIIFGHTHYPENRQIEGQRLLFNPGSPSARHPRVNQCSYGVLEFDHQAVRGRIIPLAGA